jgi:hypothetical protein
VNEHAGLNNWHNIYMLEGNFWSDYEGPDDDMDGIGDEPWPWWDFDVYPFMAENGWETLTPIEEEIINAKFDPEANKAYGGRDFRNSEKGYLIPGVIQLFSKRVRDTYNPPYTFTLTFGGMDIVLIDSVWYFDEEGQIYGEPGLCQFFYLVIEPNFLTDYWFLELGNNYPFLLEYSYYDYGEPQIASFPASWCNFNLVE